MRAILGFACGAMDVWRSAGARAEGQCQRSLTAQRGDTRFVPPGTATAVR